MTSDKTPSDDVHIILSQLQDIASAVMHAAEAHTYEQVLERIAQVARDLIQANYAALGIPDGHGGLTYFKVSGMTPEQMRQMDHLPVGRGLIGAIMREQHTLRLAQMRDDVRSVGFCPAHPLMQSFLGTPVRVGDQLFGMLYLCDKRDGQPFTERDEWLIETIAGYAALAIAGSRLHENKQRLSLLEERQRISMELHDGVIQSLYAVGMYLDLLRSEDSISPDALSRAISDLNTTIDDIRHYIMNLKRSEEQHTSVRGALHELMQRLDVNPGVVLELEAPDTQPLFPTQTFEAICQIINEALSNAVRHARASRVRVTALQNENSLLVIVTDNGIGFDTARIQAGEGLGLRNIQQRAQLHGGQVYIESAPGEGTRVTLTVPVRSGMNGGSARV